LVGYLGGETHLKRYVGKTEKNINVLIWRSYVCIKPSAFRVLFQP
jgi:hypothetical protein